MFNFILKLIWNNLLTPDLFSCSEKFHKENFFTYSPIFKNFDPPLAILRSSDKYLLNFMQLFNTIIFNNGLGLVLFECSEKFYMELARFTQFFKELISLVRKLVPEIKMFNFMFTIMFLTTILRFKSIWVFEKFHMELGRPYFTTL